jgi:putative transposase
VPLAGLCRKARISQATYFSCKSKFVSLLRDGMRRLKALEDENSRLKKIVADLVLDREMLQGVICRKLYDRPGMRACDAGSERTSSQLSEIISG